MTRLTRRTVGLLVASLVLALSATPLTPAVRAAGVTTWLVANGDEVLNYTEGSACADPDFWTDGGWSEAGSGDGDYDSDEDAIQDAIDNASSGDTIFVCFGRYDFDTDLHIFDPGMSLTIVGDGIGATVLDGTDSTRLINANPAGDDDDGGTLTLRDLSIEDARTASVLDNGGAVNADGLAIIRVSISGSDNAYNGGALYAEGNVSIVDSTFTDNDTSEYGAVLYSWNPARTVSISNSVFDGNTAGGGGGAILATTATVTGSTFTGNEAVNGGAIVAYDTATVSASTFRDNTATNSGGAIYAGHTTVSASTFRDNTATNGGAIHTGPATLIASAFTNNSADIGGAINASTATITSSTFTGNGAITYGGAIIAYDTAIVTRSTFTGNNANLGGAITSGIVNATANTFTDNDAEFLGGAIYAWSSATLDGSSFNGNDAGSFGGAIYASTATISRSRFTRNSAGQHGGAVALNSPTHQDLRRLRGNTFSRNTAASGGAFTLGGCVAPSRGEVAIVERANRFSGNRATEQRRTRNVEIRSGDCA